MNFPTLSELEKYRHLWTPQENARLDYLLSYNKVQSLLTPTPWQLAPLEDQSFILLLTGSAGGGKSRTGLEIVHRYMQRYPGATGLMMRKAREWTEKSIVPFLKQSVIGATKVAEHKKADKLFQYGRHSTLYYGGMKDDDQRESVRSIGGDGGLDIALFEEANAFTEDDFNEILGRMRGKAGPYRQIILMTNPDSPMHWIFRRLIASGEAKVYYSSAADNPYNPPEYIDNLKRMTGMLYQRLVLGKWVQAEGVIYDNFDLESNVSEEADYNPALGTIIWGVDDGYSSGQGIGSAGYHARVILFGQQTPQGGMNVFAEYTKTNELSEVSIAHAIALGYPLAELAYVDSSAQELIRRIQDSGITTFSATHKVSEGIKNVRRLICDGQGVRLLKIHPRCKETIREFLSYHYSPNFTGVNAGEPAPEKVDDHHMDALRYLCHSLRYTL